MEGEWRKSRWRCGRGLELGHSHLLLAPALQHPLKNFSDSRHVRPKTSAPMR